MESGPLGAGVYPARPLAPLRDALSAALGSPTREEVLAGAEVAPLWRTPVLRSRLVQAFADHARRCGAGRIAAADAGILPLASAVADRLAVPLDRRREPGRRGRRGALAPATYLVARVLHEREEGPRFSGGGRPPGRPLGAGVLFRVRSRSRGGMSGDEVLYIIDL